MMELADALGDEHGCQVTIAHFFDCRIEQFVLIGQGSCLLADYTLAGKLVLNLTNDYSTIFAGCLQDALS